MCVSVACRGGFSLDVPCLVYRLSWCSSCLGCLGGVFFHRLWVLGLVGVPGFVAGVFGVGMPVCFFSGLDNH